MASDAFDARVRRAVADAVEDGLEVWRRALAPRARRAWDRWLAHERQPSTER